MNAPALNYALHSSRVEQRFCKPQAVGSNPTGGTNSNTEQGHGRALGVRKTECGLVSVTFPAFGHPIFSSLNWRRGFATSLPFFQFAS